MVIQNYKAFFLKFLQFVSGKKKDLLLKEEVSDNDLYKSKEFYDCIKYLNTITSDLTTLLYLTNAMRTRGNLKDNCIVFSSIDFITESLCAIQALILHGMHNPIKRELRYLIETLITFSYVEKHFQGEKLIDKISLFEEHVSINVVDEINFQWLDESDNKQFKNEIKDIYKKLCKYVHPSNIQIEEYQKRCNKGNYIGYESIKDIQSLNKLIFRVYDILCVCILDCIGTGLAGDIFVQVLDDKSEWKFHKGKYTKLMSKYFDYKQERKN